MRALSYAVTCFACSVEVGAIVAGKLRRHACGKALPYRSGRARCCECGGSLYLEPVAEVIEEQALGLAERLTDGRDSAGARPVRGAYKRAAGA